LLAIQPNQGKGNWATKHEAAERQTSIAANATNSLQRKGLNADQYHGEDLATDVPMSAKDLS
jgi:hypothetical protein